jgi:hypothetical protein
LRENRNIFKKPCRFENLSYLCTPETKQGCQWGSGVTARDWIRSKRSLYTAQKIKIEKNDLKISLV